MNIYTSRNIFFGLLLLSYARSYPNPKLIFSGVSYEHITTNKPPLSVHLVYIDPKKVKIIIDTAEQKCIGSETTKKIADRNKAIVAINGSFNFEEPSKISKLLTKTLDLLGYNNYNTIPIYGLKINNNWLSLSNILTGVIGWKQDTQKLFFDIGKTSLQLSINNKFYPVTRFNKTYNSGSTIYSHVYIVTPEYNSKSTEIVVANGLVQNILHNSYGKTEIPKNGFIYVVFEKNKIDISNIKIGDSAHFNINYESKNTTTHELSELWNSMDYVMASTPLLLKNNTIVSTILELTSNFYIKKYPRTAVGVLPDGTWILLVVDGNQKTSAGLSLVELANYMKDLGCTDALNLDGGSSSTMIIKNKIINSPSMHEWAFIKSEKPVSHALLVIPK